MNIEVGNWAMCARGTKSGWGEVKGVSTDLKGRALYFVEFPPVDYPASMCVIGGMYCIPAHDILRVEKERPQGAMG